MKTNCKTLIITFLAISVMHGIPVHSEEASSKTEPQLAPVIQEQEQVLKETVKTEEVKEETKKKKAKKKKKDKKKKLSDNEIKLQEQDKEIHALIKSGIEENQYMTLEKCLNVAIANNPVIKSAISNTEVHKHRVGKAKAGYFPRINLSNGYSVDNANTTSATDPSVNNLNIVNIGVSQLLFDFGKTSTDIDIQKTKFTAKEQDLKAQINQTIFNVKKAYFELQLAFHRQGVMEESVEQFEQLLSQAQAFYEVGSKPKIDVMTAEVNLSNAKLSLIRSTNIVDIAFASLNNTMGLPESPTYQLIDKLQFVEKDYNFDELIETAYNNRPDFKSAILQVEASEKSIKLAKKDYYPSIGGFSGFSLKNVDDDVNSATDSGWNAGLSMNLPVLNAYLVKKNINEARASYDKECSDAQSLKNNLYFQVKQTYMEFIESKNSVPTLEVALEQAKESYELAKGRYEVGVGNTIELKDAELTYRNAKLAHFNALYDYNVSLAKIENVTGSKF